MGRRVMIDVGEGIVTWMNPSTLHVRQVSARDKVVSLAAALLKIPVKDMRDLHWKDISGPGNVRLEADAANYIGNNAEELLAARDRVALEASTPPDLVVEVEVTHFDEDNPRHYADLGVTEMWRVYCDSDSDPYNVEILALQTEGGPKELEESRVLPGFSALILPEALDFGELCKDRELEELLNETLKGVNKPEACKDTPECLVVRITILWINCHDFHGRKRKRR